MTTPENTVMVSGRKIENDRVNVTFPEVKGFLDSQAQSKVNEKIQDTVYKMIWNESFKKEARLLAEGNYQVTLNQGNALSLIFELAFFSPENCLAQKKVKSFTFNLKTGEVFKFEDIFRSDSDYIERINKIIKRQIIERDIPLLRKFKTIEENEKFYLTPEAVVVYYPSNEYTPVEYGILYFSINIEDVRDLIYSRGPLGKL